MTQEEFEGKWDQMDEKVEAKWGKLTRVERNVLGERWQKRNANHHELYDISDAEAKRAVAVLNESSPKVERRPSQPRQNLSASYPPWNPRAKSIRSPRDAPGGE